MTDLLLVNGRVQPADQFKIDTTNRSFRYGDGVFERINVANRYPLFFRAHYSRLITGLDTLGLSIPGDFSFMYFFRCLMELIEANNINNGSIRLTAFREGAGTYTPLTDTFTWIGETSRRADDLTFYPLNKTGLKLGIYEDHKKPLSSLSSIKTNNAIIPVLAGKFIGESGLDEAVVLNTNDAVAEAVSSNIFYFKTDTIYTPAPNEGGLAGVMRTVIKKLAIWNKINFEEQTVSINDLKSADEVFITNVSKGIQWVGELDGSRYGNDFTRGLHIKLNERVSKILESR